MEINGTLFIQAVNFGIAYFCLQELLFKPVVAMLDQEAAKKERLQAEIESRKLKVQELEERKHQEWLQFQHYFSTHRPVPLESRFVFQDLFSVPAYHELSEQKQQQLVRELQTSIVAKVRDVA